MSGRFHKFDDRTWLVATDDVLAEVASKLLVVTFKAILQKQARLIFVPSSGRTPLKTYQLLASNYRHSVDWARVTVVQMDEYCSDTLDPKVYFRHFLLKRLVEPLNIGRYISMRDVRTDRLHAPAKYDRMVAAQGPIDVALHGIGRNGHIGFNEPRSAADSPTRIVELAAETRQDNFPKMSKAEWPRFGMTLGLKALSHVKHSLLIASGQQKAAAVAGLVNRAPVAESPACALWACPETRVIVDRSAARELYRSQSRPALSAGWRGLERLPQGTTDLG